MTSELKPMDAGNPALVERYGADYIDGWNAAVALSRAPEPAGREELPAGHYKIVTLHDLLAVPTHRRGECLRQLQYAMELHDFATGGEPSSIFEAVWRDDGDKSVDMSVNGEPLLRLEVTDATPDSTAAGDDRVRTALRDALAFVGQRSDGTVEELAERAELWMRESHTELRRLSRREG